MSAPPRSADVKLRDELRPIGQLRQQSKQRIAGGENVRLLDSLPIIEFQFCPGKRAGGSRPDKIIGQRNPRRSGQAKHGIFFHAHAKRGVKPVPQIAVEFAGVAVVVALGGFGPALILKMEGKERVQVRAKRIV